MYGHLAGFPCPKATRVGRLARWLLEASFEDKHCPSWRCYGSDPPFSSLASQIYIAQSTLGSRFIQKVRESFKGREIWGDGGYKSQMRMSLWTPEVSRLGSGLLHPGSAKGIRTVWGWAVDAGSDRVLETTCLAPVEAHAPLLKRRTGVRVGFRSWLLGSAVQVTVWFG